MLAALAVRLFFFIRPIKSLFLGVVIAVAVVLLKLSTECSGRLEELSNLADDAGMTMSCITGIKNAPNAWLSYIST